MHLATFFLFSACCFSVQAADSLKFANPIEVEVSSDAGEQYNLRLTRAEESVLHPNIKVISVRENAENGQLSFDSWTPSNEDLQTAQDIYVDEKNIAAIRFKHDAGSDPEMQGVVDGRRIEKHSDGRTVLSESSNQNHSDYIDVGRTITPSRSRQGGVTNAIVEVVLVCDKEFGDLFQHDRRRILDYFTVYFWDVNLRYKTLPSSNIAFRITGIVVISVSGNDKTPSGQPFIEESRASDGRAELGRILGRFASWTYSQMDSLPKFDIAIAITNTRLEWGGGLAYYKTACLVDNGGRRHFGTLVFNDDGGWGSLTVGAHEIGHSVGAPHDDDPNFPGGCDDRGYIMSGGNNDLKWFFSTCSDRVIGEFVRSNEASCLRRIDENSSPAISPDFSSVSAPNMEEQCRKRLNRPDAFVKDEDRKNCKVMKCWVPNDGGWRIWSLAPVDNNICNDGFEGRCFRGRCRRQGSLVRNVGTSQCLRATNPFHHMTHLEMVDCATPGTPLDRFVISDESNGKLLATPYSSPDAKENGDKCVYTGNSEGDALWTDRCNAQNSWHGWDFINVGNNEFLLSHRVTKRCAKPSGNIIRSYANCDRNDRNMRWRLQ